MTNTSSPTDDSDLRSFLERLLDVLKKEAEAKHPQNSHDTPFLCAIQPLPAEKWAVAAQRAVQINPANRPATHLLGLPRMTAMADIASPESIAVLTSKYWGSGGVTLTVGFLEPIQNDLRDRIVSHMNAWNEFANVAFLYSRTDPQVRITRGPGGFKSYLGTDILHAESDAPTMWLQAFTMATRDSEFFRVIRHETGHTLGFPHEHTRQDIVDLIDREKAITLFMRTQGWSREEVIAQVLTPLEQSAIIATTHADPTSIMCYSLPGIIMRDGQAVPGGTDIDSQDAQFASVMYPKTASAPASISKFY